jgi:hypothetical protein
VTVVKVVTSVTGRWGRWHRLCNVDANIGCATVGMGTVAIARRGDEGMDCMCERNIVEVR